MEIVAHFPFTDVRPFLDQSQTQMLGRPDWRSSAAWPPTEPPARDAFVRWLGPAYRADGDDFGWCSAARLVRLPPPGLLAGALRGFSIGWRTLGVNGSGAMRLELAASTGSLAPPGRRVPIEDVARQLLATEFDVGLRANGDTATASLIEIGSVVAQSMLASTTPTTPLAGYSSSESWLTAGRPMLIAYYRSAEKPRLPAGAERVRISSGVPCRYSALTFKDVRVGIWYVATDGASADDVTKLDLCLRRRHALREALVGLCLGLEGLAGQIDEKALFKSMDSVFRTLYDKEALYGIRRSDLREFERVESRNVSTIGDGTLTAITDTVKAHSQRLLRNVQRLQRSPQEALERGTLADRIRWCMAGAGGAILSGAAVFCEIVLAGVASKHGPAASVPLRFCNAVLGAFALAALYVAVLCVWYGTVKRAKRVVPMVRSRLDQLSWFSSLILIPALLAAFLIP